MIEITPEVFVVGPTRARSNNTIMYKAVHMTYEVSPDTTVMIARVGSGEVSDAHVRRAAG